MKTMVDARKGTKTQKDLFGAFLVVTGGLQLANLFFLFFMFIGYLNIANKKPPSLVQLANGQSFTTAPMGDKDRTPAVVQRFTADTLTRLMTWTGKLPAVANTSPNTLQTYQADNGVDIKTEKGNQKVATTTWQASFAISEDFRPELLKKIAELTPPEVFTGQTQVVLITQEITAPVLIAPGKWKVTIVANLQVFSQDNSVGKAVPFNKEVFVQAIDTAPLTAGATPLEQVIYEIRQARLEIYAMRDLPRKDLTQ